MSLEAMAWVLNEAPGLPSHAFGVLMGLANHADKFGLAAFPSQATLALYARKSVRQVRRDLDDLVAAGLIRRGEGRYVAHLSADERPIVWDLAMEKSASAPKPKARGTGRTRPVVDVRPDIDDHTDVDDRSFDEGPDETAGHEGLDRTPTSGRSPTSGRTSTAEGPDVDVLLTVPKPSPSSSTKKKVSTAKAKQPAKEPEPEHPRFADFWAVYPNKVKKPKAREAFAAVIANGHDPDAVIAAVKRYRDSPLRNPRYTAHPTTWLHDERWDDEPEPEPTPDELPFPGADLKLVGGIGRQRTSSDLGGDEHMARFLARQQARREQTA